MEANHEIMEKRLPINSSITSQVMVDEATKVYTDSVTFMNGMGYDKAIRHLNKGH